MECLCVCPRSFPKWQVSKDDKRRTAHTGGVHLFGPSLPLFAGEDVAPVSEVAEQKEVDQAEDQEGEGKTPMACSSWVALEGADI